MIFPEGSVLLPFLYRERMVDVNELDDSLNNLHTIRVSGVASCFGCMKVFPHEHILKWVDAGNTAICPHCDLDSVVAGFVNEKDLKDMTTIILTCIARSCSILCKIATAVF